MTDDDAATGAGMGDGRAIGPDEFGAASSCTDRPSPGDRVRPLDAATITACSKPSPGRPRGSVCCGGTDGVGCEFDVFAGISVVAYLVPQVMAYTALVGVPPVVGLWTALVALVVYALVGSSRVLSVGPESTIALMTGTAIAPLAGADAERAVALAAALSLIVGGWCLVGRIARLGVISDLLSQPLLVGYLAGAAALMVVGQLGKMTGTSVEGDNLVAQLRSFAEVVDDTHLLTLAVGVGTLGLLLAIHVMRPRWPATLIAVAAATVVCVVGRPGGSRGRRRGRRAVRAPHAWHPGRDMGRAQDPRARRARHRGDRLQRQHAERPGLPRAPRRRRAGCRGGGPPAGVARPRRGASRRRSDERVPGLLVRIPHRARRSALAPARSSIRWSPRRSWSSSCSSPVR